MIRKEFIFVYIIIEFILNDGNFDSFDYILILAHYFKIVVKWNIDWCFIILFIIIYIEFNKKWVDFWLIIIKIKYDLIDFKYWLIFIVDLNINFLNLLVMN